MDEQEELQVPEGEEQTWKPEKGPEEESRQLYLHGMYESWFLDYASYVILERAVPEITDGLKPVQRRILHAMYRIDDGRFNKVANLIGQTMQYHPHGDASIGDALVQLGQKDLLIETQGNWGNVLTGDSAAAPRYIEARLSALAKEVVFNPKTTDWKASYDGRNKEPVMLPVKFPLLLAQGVEGIAVGLASKILPHNFNELIDASILYLQGKDFELYPDFNTGGMADVSKYNEGIRGGKVRIRAKISQRDKKTLVITEIPYSTTTSTLIDTIVAASEKGKIKIRKIDDNTAEHVEIVIFLANNVSPDQTIDALYAFTSCEVSISPNSCVILDGKPNFISVKEILKNNTDNTVALLKKELEIRLGELNDHWHYASLEKIFIENRIYLLIEECETWESVLSTIDKGLEPFKKILKREVTEDDLVQLTEIKIKRISKFNAFKAEEQIKKTEEEMEEVRNHLEHLVDFTINYFRQIKKKFGKNKERKTELRNFDTIQASAVAVSNEKLYINREEGFAGTGLKKDEYVCDCSDLDDIIVFKEDGTCSVIKVAEKVFIGKGVIYLDVFKKNDDRTIYNMVYRDGKQGNYYVKRFPVKGVTRDKTYDLTKGTANSRVVYFSANPNGEAEVIRINLRPRPRMKKTSIDFDFSELAIKGRASLGNILSRTPIRNIVKREEGVSTLGARDIWYDETVRRLNSEDRGKYLGAFKGDDKILMILSTGEFKLTGFDLSTHFEDELIYLEKFDPDKIFSVVYFDGALDKYYVKRFQIEEDTPVNKRTLFISEAKGSQMALYSVDYLPRLEMEVESKSSSDLTLHVVHLADYIGVKSFRARGKRLGDDKIKKLRLIDPIPYEPSEVEESDEEEVIDEEKMVAMDEDTDSVEMEQDEEEGESPAPESQKDKEKREGEDTSQMELF
ncbi:MAG: DNA gyrase/topoisomerase IV subunit A [Bacteroidales bacterium]|nr:DNA gyrase/topoisomerase IV subunit A [Bacteroidales bacterium]